MRCSCTKARIEELEALEEWLGEQRLAWVREAREHVYDTSRFAAKTSAAEAHVRSRITTLRAELAQPKGEAVTEVGER